MRLHFVTLEFHRGGMWHAICSSVPCDKRTNRLEWHTDQQTQAAATPTPARSSRAGMGGWAATPAPGGESGRQKHPWAEATWSVGGGVSEMTTKDDGNQGGRCEGTAAR